MLRSKALRGYAHHNGETVRDAEGMPVQLAEPLVTSDEWQLIQAALDKTQEARRDARFTVASPLAGLVVCYECGGSLHHDRNTVKRDRHEYVYRYYRCVNRITCRSAMIPAGDLEELAEATFLDEFGDLGVRERVWLPGDSHEAELREAVAGYEELLKTAGRAVSATAKQRLQAQLDALDARIAGLESAPAREARWEYRETGQKYRAVWESSGTDGRRELLQRSGITIAASITGVDRRSKYQGGTWRLEIRAVPDVSGGIGPPKSMDPSEAARAAAERERYNVPS
jgi:hypothetical protein